MYVSRMVVFLLSCIFFPIVYLKSRERTQTQILQRMWLLLWHIGVPACMSLSTCLAQNMEFVAVKREVKSGMYRLSPPCAEKVFFSRHRSQLSSASTKRTRCCCFFFDCAAQLFAVTFSHPLLGLFQVICLWFASFLFAGILVSEEDVVWPLRVFAIVSPMKWSNQGNRQCRDARDDVCRTSVR